VACVGICVVIPPLMVTFFCIAYRGQVDEGINVP